MFFKDASIAVLAQVVWISTSYIHAADEAESPLNDVCDFWQGAVYFQGSCYNLVTGGGYLDVKTKCKESHGSSIPAEVNNTQAVRFLSYYHQHVWGNSSAQVYVGATRGSEALFTWDHSNTPVLSTLVDITVTPSIRGSCLVLVPNLELFTDLDCDHDLDLLCEIDVVDLCPGGDHVLAMASCYTQFRQHATLSDAQTYCRNTLDARLAEFPSLEKLVMAMNIVNWLNGGASTSLVLLGAERLDFHNFRWIESGIVLKNNDGAWGKYEPNHQIDQEPCLGIVGLVGPYLGLHDTACYKDAFWCETVDMKPIRYVTAFPRSGHTDYQQSIKVIVSAMGSTDLVPGILALIATEGEQSKVSSFEVGGSNIFTYSIDSLDDILLDVSGTYGDDAGGPVILVTTFSEVAVSFVYEVRDQNSNKVAHTSSFLHPIIGSPQSAQNTHFYIVISTTSCAGIPVVEGSTEIDVTQAKRASSQCQCRAYFAVVALDRAGEGQVQGQVQGHVTHVTIDFPRRGVEFLYRADNIAINNPTTLVVELRRYQVAYVASSDDLSGTFVHGTGRLAVLMGYSTYGLTSGSTNQPSSRCNTGHSFTQAKSVTHASTNHVTLPSVTTNQLHRDVYRVSSLYTNTEVWIKTDDDEETNLITLEHPGDVREFALPSTRIYKIKSNFPLMAYKLSFAGSAEFVECLTLLPSESTSSSDGYEISRQIPLNDAVVYFVAYEPASRNEYAGITVNGDLLSDLTPTPVLKKNGSWAVATWSMTLTPRDLNITIANLENLFVFICEWNTNNRNFPTNSGYCAQLAAKEDAIKNVSIDLDALVSAYKQFDEYAQNIQYGFDVIEYTTTESSTLQTYTPNATDVTEVNESTTLPVSDLDNTTQLPVPDLDNTTPGGGDCLLARIPNLTLAEVRQLAQQIQNKLRINPRGTSSFLRTLSSAEDDRPSSKAVGMFGVILITITFVLMVVPDAISVTVWCMKKCGCLREN